MKAMGTIGAALIAGTSAWGALAQEAAKPNILLIVSDDTGWGDLGPYGGGEGRGMPTPNIDRLADEGMTFFSFYAQPSCTPGRAAIQTGRIPNRSGMTTVAFQGSGGGLPAAEWTLASVLKTAGYAGTAADRLDRSAQRFYDQVSYDGARPRTTEEAARLAEATRDFNRAVDRDRSRDDLRPSFDRVADRYHQLRRQLVNRDSRYADASVAFDRVTEAYLDVDRAMNHGGSAYRD